MPQINQSCVTAFRQARDNLVTLLEQQATFLRHDIDSRSYVIPCLRLQIAQQLDIVANSSIKMAVESRHHPFVLVHQSGYYETTVPMHCTALKGQCIHLANRLSDNLCTDVPISVAGLIDQINAHLSTMSSPRRGPVLTFRREREAFIFCLQMQANTLRADPQAAETVATSLRELVDVVLRIKAASMVMAVDARGNAYVLAKPYGFYSRNVPLMCNDLVACLLHWADILINTDGRRTDGIVVLGIEGVLASLGF